MQEDTAEGWMSNFPDHPIFAPICTSSSSESLESPNPRKLIAAIINQNDLVIAHEHELRFTSMSKFKSIAGASTRNAQKTSYQILKPTTSSSFPKSPITQLVPNPTSQLLAVCSSYQISVIALPRLDEHPDDSACLECETLSIGRFESGESNEIPTNRVVKLLWHGLSYRASTLLVLYSDGIVHEFDITKDCRNPAQILDLNSPLGILPTQPSDQDDTDLGEPRGTLVARMKSSTLSASRISSRRRNGSGTFRHETPRRRQESIGLGHLDRNRREGTFSAEDVSASRAVTMCFGSGDGDWGPLTLYGLMENGDVYTICPYLPRNAAVPMTYKSALLFFLTTKLDTLTKSGLEVREPQEFQNLQTSLYHSLDFLNAIEKLSQAREDLASGALPPTSELIDLYGMLKARPLRQGPFLMQPSPIELNTESEELATDLIHVRYQSQSSTSHPDSDPSASSVGVFMIAYQSRIDVHIEVDKIEPCWQPHGVVLSEETEQLLPVLITHETIDLQLPKDIQTVEDTFGIASDQENRLSIHFVRDTRHPDVVFVWHRFGVQAVSMFRWIERLTGIFQDYSTSASIPPADLQQAINGLGGGDVKWVVKTASTERPSSKIQISTPPMVQCMAVIDEAYLGYGLLVIVEGCQTLLHPLKHRPVSSLDLRSPTTPRSHGDHGSGAHQNNSPTIASARALTYPRADGIAADHRPYVSLLTKPWKPSSFLSGRPGSQSLSRLKKPENLGTVDSKTFRYMAEMSKELDRQIRQLIEAANDGQDRLKLQLMEYERQLSHTCSAQETLARLSQEAKLSQDIEARILRITDSQKKLLERSDLILQRLSDSVNPSLSVGETRWFSELRRMKAEVIDGESDTRIGTGLNVEIEKFKTELQSVNEAIKKLPEHLRLEWTLGKAPGKLGDTQIADIHHKLAKGTTCLQFVNNQIQELNTSLTNINKHLPQV
ncbi:hypothetical protein CROQUDRAFT_654356 [Cronartium quercuum f. sp. fusiforme G11]|uniref:Uncharacterized protein n=1 Tax=Cronartium quercuum f. sp. fusiforme G11 TaxID=708437 RepID=A0A9P6NR86_9BASI|nr:hypothetical protein CROQUDRAFT_654356 [Cronartium quercuum f. sp. fusiforme G11]